LFDEPAGMEAGLRESWDAVRDGLADGADDATVPVLVASTLAELLQDDSAAAFLDRGVPAVAGLRTALACAAALRRLPGDPARLRAIAAAAAAARAPEPGAWLSEADAKTLLRTARIAVPPGRVVAGEDDAVAAARELGGPVAIKASSAALQHKSDAGALALGVVGDDAVRAAYRRVAAAAHVASPDENAGRGTAAQRASVSDTQRGGEEPGEPGDGLVLVETMAEPGVELIVAARRDGVVPALVVGLGGVWTELLGDVAVVPLPASPARVERALQTLRGFGVLAGARGGAAVDLGALTMLAARAGQVLLDEDLVLLELNPVIVRSDGAVVVDAVARRALL
jgi:acyl-CoA synthetase (NDP forming)